MLKNVGGKGKGKRQKGEPAFSGAIRKFSLLPFAFSLSTDAFFSNLLEGHFCRSVGESDVLAIFTNRAARSRG
jgi:hypothetical protein